MSQARINIPIEDPELRPFAGLRGPLRTKDRRRYEPAPARETTSRYDARRTGWRRAGGAWQSAVDLDVGALDALAEERKARHSRLLAVVSRTTALTWSQDFMEALRACR